MWSVLLMFSGKTVKSGAFRDCPSLKAVDLPSTIREIEVGAFEGCTSLQNIIIHGSTHFISTEGVPEGVTVVYVAY